MAEEIKTAIDEFNNAFEEFKKVNDERLSKIEDGQGVIIQDTKEIK